MTMKKEQHMKINSEAKRLAALVFAEKETANQQAKLEETLNRYEAELMELSEKEKAARDGNTDLSEKFESLKTQKAELEDKLKVSDNEKAELTKQVAEFDKKIKELEGTISKMETEAKVHDRIKELEGAGLLLKGKAAERQLKRIKSMADEDFAEWLDEQKAFKAEVIEQAKAEFKTKDVDADKDKDKDDDADAKGKDQASDKDADSDDNDDFDDTVKNMSKAELIKAMRASAGLNWTSTKKASSDDLDPAFAKKLSTMWDDEEKKDRS